MIMCFKGTFSEALKGEARKGKLLMEPAVECRGSGPVKKYNINDPDCPQHMKDCWKRLTGRDGM